jgi:PAS domain S-box-containing protein
MIYGWMKRKVTIGPVYYWLLLVFTIWMILYATVLATANAAASHYLSLLEYVCSVILPVGWLYFAFDFAGQQIWKSRWALIASLILPVVLILVAVTGSDPGLLFDHFKFFHVPELNPHPATAGSSGNWIYVHYAYSLGYFILATALLIVSLIRNQKVTLTQAIILGLGIIVPWFGFFTFIFRISPIGNFDPSPYAFTLSASLMAFGLNFNRSINIVTTARRSVVDRMVEGLVVLDGHNLILDINSAALKIFRINAANTIGQPAETVFRNWPDLIDNLRYYSRKNQNLQIQVNGDTTYYLLDINPLFDRKGEVMGKMLIFHDVTSLKQTELKLIEAKARAEQSDNLKSAFLANMSHEIRTPMNVIIGFSNLLNDSEVSLEEREEFVEHIKNSGNSLLQLIDDIIDISKLDAGQIVQENNRLSITRLLAELFAYFNESLQESGKKGVQLLVSGISENVDWTVMADGVKINRIMRHLLANAVKFTSTGFIEFGVKMVSPDKLTFYVQDSGIGIAREKQGMIFERFSRVMTGTRQEYGGTGMGLAICKGLTELMGGTIWVESNLGSGSTFFVSLPVTEVEELPITEPLFDLYGKAAEVVVPAGEMPVEAGLISVSSVTGGPVPQENWNNKVVLVLEPSEMVYLNIEMIVRHTRVKLIWAKSLAEAMNYIERDNAIHAVVASAQLDDATVEDSMNLLSSKLPGIPIVAVIPFEGSALSRTCRELGCKATIHKPILPVSLLRALSPFLS